MRVITKTVMAFWIVMAMGSAQAFESLRVSEEQQQCYAKAMIGLDSVINSRLGVPPEHALDLAVMLPVAANDRAYSKDMLKTVLNAYFWEDSPHSYAVKVFYHCAASQSYRSAHLDVRNHWGSGE